MSEIKLMHEVVEMGQSLEAHSCTILARTRKCSVSLGLNECGYLMSNFLLKNIHH